MPSAPASVRLSYPQLKRAASRLRLILWANSPLAWGHIAQHQVIPAKAQEVFLEAIEAKTSGKKNPRHADKKRQLSNPERMINNVADIGIEMEAHEAGFDSSRLARIDRHFQRYVDDGRLPGWLILVSRHGKIVHLSTYGQRDKEAGLPVKVDTLWRIKSLTKPITSVAAMMLYEEGAFELKDPVSRFIPSFEKMRVYQSGSAVTPVTLPVTEPVRIWHLLTHTSGLTYAFHHATTVDAMYRLAGIERVGLPGADLAANCDVWASLPLLFQPGSEWNYSVSTDVLGRVIELASGQTLDAFLSERIFEPLGMTDTGFWVKETNYPRLAALYAVTPGTRLVRRLEAEHNTVKTRPFLLSGGSGLISTTADYYRFTRMLLNGGELDGARLLGTRTLRYMIQNHLPGGADLEEYGRPLFSESTYAGIGFGLGFSVVLNSIKNKVLSSIGEFAWGGATSTAFWVDPAEEIIVLFFTQLLPSSIYPIRTQLRQLVYQALVD